MGGGSGYQPPSRDEDAVTYLPVDRAKETRIGFGPTDLRGKPGVGGTRLGHTTVFIKDEAMARLDADAIAEACDNLVRAQQTYNGLLYLSRCQPEDVGAVMQASQSYEIKTRWERLWVLSPYMARLARRDEAKAALIAGFKEDLAGLHLLSKFAEQKNPAIKRLYARLGGPLLEMLLERLCDSFADPRRAVLLAGILATIQTDAAQLSAHMPKSANHEVKERALSMLFKTQPTQSNKKLSSASLRERLKTWQPK